MNIQNNLQTTFGWEMIKVSANRVTTHDKTIIIAPDHPTDICEYCYKIAINNNVRHCKNAIGIRNLKDKCTVTCKLETKDINK
jgi:hypothetical protein